MLYFLEQFADTFVAFNVFRYHDLQDGRGGGDGAVLRLPVRPEHDRVLRLRQGKGQPIREDGPAGHLLTKKGTPTMGGLMILFGAVGSTLLWANLANGYVWMVLFVTIGFGAIGFYDDYLKVKRMSHAGFRRPAAPGAGSADCGHGVLCG